MGNTRSVQAQLGGTGTWTPLDFRVPVPFVLDGDWFVPSHLLLPDLLHEGLEVLIYAGDCDYICNWLGNKAWTKVLEWDGKDEFIKAQDSDWQVDGKTVARLRTARSFHFMQVFEAGNMVPMDQPAAALAMVNAFVSGKMSEHVAQQSEIVV